MIMLLALIANTPANINDVAPDFLKSWLIVAIVALGVTVQLIGLKRKPSVDEELAGNSGRHALTASEIETLKGQNRLIFKKLDGITDTLAALKQRQGENAVAITHIEASMKSFGDQVQSLVEHELNNTRCKS